MIGYKLTDQRMQTFNDTQWQLGEWKKTDGFGNLCGSGWLHYYSDPLLAVLLNPIHAGFSDPRLFEAEVDGLTKEDRGLKFGCTKMRLVKELQLPAITAEQRVKFAIYCTLEVCADPAFVTWANNWLNGIDRTAETAGSARCYIYRLNYQVITHGIAKSLQAACWALDAAVEAVATRPTYTEDLYCAYSANYATEAAKGVKDLNLIALAQKAIG